VRFDSLPHLNAILNSLSTVLLIIGFVLIKQGKWRAHAAAMLSATVTSLAFLAGYLLYHAHHGETRISRDMPWVSLGWRKTYYWVLFPHLLLAIVMVPMILSTLFLAYRRRWTSHHKIGQPTFWIWLYVSFTGVVIYWMLYHLFPGQRPPV
jgi:uncharacterized membrane protein YozB (DUF420 family)